MRKQTMDRFGITVELMRVNATWSPRSSFLFAIVSFLHL